ncbi:MAG: cytochrome d ubiquinol oxidase subunit II [Dehalococcoidia bacterium]
MSLEVLAAGVVLLGLIAYAVFAGADFGGGVWTALAWGPRARGEREAIFRAMGPVWETNHVWLILIVVTLFTAFPRAFADLFTALLIPLVIALVGIVFRGAAFAFRHYGHEGGASLPATGLVFSVASVVTPLAMGMALGAIAGGRVHIQGGQVVSGLYAPWLRPFSILCGLIAVAICGFLTACFMTTRTTGALREDFRSRGLAASVVLGGLTTVAIPVAYFDAAPFFDRLAAPAPIAVMSSAVVMGVASLVVLWRRWYVLAPPVAAGTVALVIAAWGAVQYPYFILPDVRIHSVAAGHATLVAFLVSLPIGALILIPSLVLLYYTFSEKTDRPAPEEPPS